MSDPVDSRILIVDDSQAIHADFRTILAPPQSAELDALEADFFGDTRHAAQATSFALESAYQGLEAVDMVRRALAEGRPYAMAFVDVRMPPGQDGIETTAQILQLDPCILIIICTAYSDYPWEQTVLKLGHLERWLVLKKPLDVIEVRQTAHSMIERWQQVRLSQDRVESLERQVAAGTGALAQAHEQLTQERIERQQVEVVLRQAQKLAAAGRLAVDRKPSS